MILDTLSQSDRYISLHPGLAAAFDFLRRAPLADLDVGRNEIDGSRLFVLIGRDAGRGRQAAKLEAHRRYIDVQYVIAGGDEIGWKPTPACQSIDMPYNADRDIMFFADPPESWASVRPGSFVILYPEDAHAPLGTEGLAHKAVVKVAVDWS